MNRINDIQSQQADFRFNEQMINALKHSINFKNPLDVFEYVFTNLNVEITIYPTENYYYFEFTASGRRMKGNLALFANTRDKGLLNFSYEEATEYLKSDSLSIDVAVTLSISDGVLVSKLSDFKYTINFKDRTVLVNLNDKGFLPSPNDHLMPCEIYVGPSFDESGLKFYLIFNKEYKHLYWVLNEADFVPETFILYTDEILIGKRTEFAFYRDTLMKRKVLFGVKFENVYKNNWYDGPFDQLPDNFIKTGQVALKQYLEEYDPTCKGKIDEYGHEIGKDDYRVAVSSYLIYKNRTDLIKIMLACKNSSKSHSEFLKNLTAQREFNQEKTDTEIKE